MQLNSAEETYSHHMVEVGNNSLKKRLSVTERIAPILIGELDGVKIDNLFPILD